MAATLLAGSAVVALLVLVAGPRYLRHCNAVLAPRRAEGRSLDRVDWIRILRPPAFGAGFLLLAACVSYGVLVFFSGVAQPGTFGPVVWQMLIFFSLLGGWIAAFAATLWVYRRSDGNRSNPHP